MAIDRLCRGGSLSGTQVGGAAAVTLPTARLDVVTDSNASGSTAQSSGSITTGTAALTLGAGHDFAANHGIVIRGAGAAHGLAQAADPTVVAQGTTGATTYTYAICWTSGNGGWTQASNEVSIANGNATLDATNFNRVTLPAAPAGADAAIIFGRANGAMHFLGMVNAEETQWDDKGDTVDRDDQIEEATWARRDDQIEWVGRSILQPFNNTGVFYTCVRILRSQSAVTVGDEDRTASSAPTFNTSLGDETTDGLVVWRREDKFLPVTPPAAAVNDALRTTISSIDGNSATLAANASTTVSSQPVWHDDLTAVQAAITAANNAGGTKHVYFPPGTYNLVIGKSGDDSRLNSDANVDPDWCFTINAYTTFELAPDAEVRVFANSVAASNGQTPDLSLFRAGTTTNEDIRRWTITGGRFTWVADGSALWEGSTSDDRNGWTFITAVGTTSSVMSNLQILNTEIDGFPRVMNEAASKTPGVQTYMDNVKIWNYGGATSDLMLFTEGCSIENCTFMRRRNWGSRAIYDSSKSDGNVHVNSRILNTYFEGIGKRTIRVRSDNFVIDQCTFVRCFHFNDKQGVATEDSVQGFTVTNTHFLDTSCTIGSGTQGFVNNCIFEFDALDDGKLSLQGGKSVVSNCYFDTTTVGQNVFDVLSDQNTVANCFFNDGRWFNCTGNHNYFTNLNGNVTTSASTQMRIRGDDNVLNGGIMLGTNVSYAPAQAPLTMEGERNKMANFIVATTRPVDGTPKSFGTGSGSGSSTQIENCRFDSQVEILDATANIQFHNCQFPDPQGRNQTHNFSNGTAIDFYHCDFNDVPTSITAVRYAVGNTGFTTQNRGTATVANATTSIVVNHGLNVTPTSSDIQVSPIETLNSASFFWVDTITATQFTINVNADPGQDVDFVWWARALEQ